MQEGLLSDMSDMDWPEWAGYCAAFDAYVDARRHEDDELARQARLLMSYFAEPLRERATRTTDHGKRISEGHMEYDLGPLLDHLGLT